MDIYFCDLCGSRVTSVDLRGGVGMCREEDVICVRCVELGRGSDWLASHHAPGPAPVAKVVKETPSPAASPIDAARDRARTIDKDLVSEPVRAQVIEPQPPTQELAPSTAPSPVDSKTVLMPCAIVDLTPSATEDIADEAASVAGDGLDITTKIPAAQPDFSGLASSFSALGAQGEGDSRRNDAPADDLPDQQDLPDPTTGNIHKSSDPDAEPEVVVPAPAPAPAPSGPRNAKLRTSSAANPRVGGASNRSTASGMAKPATNKTSRRNLGPGASGRGARPTGFLHSKAAFKGLLIFSVIATLAMVILLYLTWCAPRKPSYVPSEPKTVHLSDEVKNGIQSVREQVQAALRREPPVEEELVKANAAIQALFPKLEEFEKKAKGEAKYTDEQVALVMQNCGWSDTLMLRRVINDKLMILRTNRSMK